MVNDILWKMLKSPCGAPLCTYYAKVHNKKNIYLYLIYNPCKFQSPSLYQWKDIAIYLKRNFVYFSFPWEGDFGFGAL